MKTKTRLLADIDETSGVFSEYAKLVLYVDTGSHETMAFISPYITKEQAYAIKAACNRDAYHTATVLTLVSGGKSSELTPASSG